MLYLGISKYTLRKKKINNVIKYSIVSIVLLLLREAIAYFALNFKCSCIAVLPLFETLLQVIRILLHLISIYGQSTAERKIDILSYARYFPL